MITYKERRLVEEQFAKDVLENPEYILALYKLIYNLMIRISPAESLQPHLAHAPKDLSKDIFEILDLAFQYDTELDKPVYYTTGEISKFFGVSITTISNWLRLKRISYPGMNTKAIFKQSRIPDTAIYKDPHRRETVLRDIIQEYERKKDI